MCKNATVWIKVDHPKLQRVKANMGIVHSMDINNINNHDAEEGRLTSDRKITGSVPALPAHVSKCPWASH